MKQERWDCFMRHQQSISARRLKRKVGTRQQVIIDEVYTRDSKLPDRVRAPEWRRAAAAATHRRSTARSM